MFLHANSPQCIFQNNCRKRLLKFKHDNKNNTITKEKETTLKKDTYKLDKESEVVPDCLNENEEDEKDWKFACQYCSYKNADEDLFDEHMKEVHND